MKNKKIVKSGNSLAVTLPASLVKALGLRAGDPVQIKISLDQTHVSCFFPASRQLSLLKPKTL